MSAHPDNGASPAAFATVSPPNADTRALLAVWKLVRPTHWVKNAFVLAPLAFAAHQAIASAVPAALLGFVSFCLLSSAVYCFNDALDAAADRAHPTKRFRPVASGAISPAAAMALSLVLAVCGFGAATRLPWSF